VKIKEMIGALQLDKLRGVEAVQTRQLITKWGEEFLADTGKKVLGEYPRPQMVRQDYTMLNGTWKYAITSDDIMPSEWDGGIRVPFSPESYMSGVGKQLKPDEYLWYKCEVDIGEAISGKRLLLNFGAVDERCRVYINGIQAGKHAGGYQAFTLDITKYINNGKNTIQLCVQDKSDTSYHGRGKQKLNNGGMFYTAQSGIWQSVWCEWVPDIYIKELMITPDYDNDSVIVAVTPNTFASDKKVEFKVTVLDNSQVVSKGQAMVALDETARLTLPINNKKKWTPETPFLYGLKIEYGEDSVESYFGMRLFSVEKDKDGKPRLCLNHEPYFQNGILDQGYYPESLMTPISDQAMINDIRTAKAKGFNMIRKHCKIEPMRWYYHCDRLGMIVWQDMINGGGSYNLLKTCYIPTVVQTLRTKKDDDYEFMGRESKKGRLEWKKECKETIKQLYNCTSICTWVLFNEGWGQFDALENTQMVREIDNTRIIDAHSGWFDQDAGDVKSEHIYFFDLEVKKSDKPYVISEYGGISLAVEDHIYSENHFGYGRHETPKTFTAEYNKLQNRIQKMQEEGLSAAVYTQMTDIEEEVNGIMTYDRKIIKI
jgi:beta-galactosidase/beta-glucuronidase